MTAPLLIALPGQAASLSRDPGLAIELASPIVAKRRSR